MAYLPRFIVRAILGDLLTPLGSTYLPVRGLVERSPDVLVFSLSQLVLLRCVERVEVVRDVYEW